MTNNDWRELIRKMEGSFVDISTLELSIIWRLVQSIMAALTTFTTYMWWTLWSLQLIPKNTDQFYFIHTKVGFKSSRFNLLLRLIWVLMFFSISSIPVGTAKSLCSSMPWHKSKQLALSRAFLRRLIEREHLAFPDEPPSINMKSISADECLHPRVPGTNLGHIVKHKWLYIILKSLKNQDHPV